MLNEAAELPPGDWSASHDLSPADRPLPPADRYWSADPMGETLIRDAESLTISAENPSGRPGMGCLEEPGRGNPAYELGRGWKARPRVTVAPGETVTLGALRGRGVVGRIWVTFTDED